MKIKYVVFIIANMSAGKYVPHHSIYLAASVYAVFQDVV